MAAACWFVWVALQGRKLAPQLAQSAQSETGDTKYTNRFMVNAVGACRPRCRRLGSCFR